MPHSWFISMYTYLILPGIDKPTYIILQLGEPPCIRKTTDTVAFRWRNEGMQLLTAYVCVIYVIWFVCAYLYTENIRKHQKEENAHSNSDELNLFFSGGVTMQCIYYIHCEMALGCDGSLIKAPWWGKGKAARPSGSSPVSKSLKDQSQHWMGFIWLLYG